MPPLLDELAAEACEADELAFAAEKPLERAVLPPLELPPTRPNETPERGAEGGATERDAIEKLRAGVAIGRAPRFAVRVALADAGAAAIVPTRALVAAVAPELTNRREAAS